MLARHINARGEKLGVAVGDLNERIAEKLEALETDDIGRDRPVYGRSGAPCIHYARHETTQESVPA